MVPFKETINTKQELIDACKRGFEDYSNHRISKNDFCMFFGFTHGKAITQFYEGNYEQLLVDGGFNTGSVAYFAGGINAWKNLRDGKYVFPPFVQINNPKPLTEKNTIFQQIFYGAPGTGKSHEVKKQTGELLDSGEERDLPNVFRTTFHPDTDYAAFVGCYKPISKNASHQLLLDYDSLVDRFKKYIADLGNITHASAAIGYNYHDSIVKIQEDGVHTIAQLLADAHKSGTTYDTTIRSGMLLYEEQARMGNSQSQIVYEFVPQAFTDAYVYAYNNPAEQTYLVIEEINRGNCAQIFGDLFQLLDRKGGVSEYKIKADKDLAQYLKEKLGVDSEGIQDGKLCLPANLHILATMNTSDQSLFPMDSAFKRRWEWEHVPINYDENIPSGQFKVTIGDKSYSWVEFIKQVNEKIFDLTQSEDKQMGNFFIKQSIDEKGFKSKVMFYLWYEVLRDETENNKYFFYKKTIVDGKEVSTKFTFKDLFGDKATETLQQFMEYLKVAPK